MNEERQSSERGGSEDKSHPESISLSVPHPTSVMKKMHRHTKLTVFGLAVPMFVIWLAEWFTFQLSPFGGLLSNLSSVSESGFPKDFPLGLKLIGTLGFGGGILYVIIGIILFFAGIFAARMTFRKMQMRGLGLGAIPLKSYLNGLFVFMSLVGFFKLTLMVLQLDLGLLNSLLGSLGGLLGGAL